MTDTKSNRNNHSKKRLAKLFGLVTIIILVLAACVYFIYPAINKSSKPPTKAEIFKQSSQDAVKAWQDGDKKKAQDLARKAEQQNSQMSEDDREKVPGQAQTIMEMDDIIDGVGPL